MTSAFQPNKTFAHFNLLANNKNNGTLFMEYIKNNNYNTE